MEDTTVAKMLFFLLAHVVLGVGAQQCFNFSGDDMAYINFETALLDLNSSAHFRLQFKTSEPGGILYYARGPHDYESLFMKNGFLNYFLFNPERHGQGSSFGANKVSNVTLNNGQWHTIEFFRNKMDRNDDTTETGLVVDGVAFKDNLPRVSVFLNQPLFFGGYSRQLSRNLPHFKGQIRSLVEVTHGHNFVEPSFSDGVNRGPRCRHSIKPQ